MVGYTQQARAEVGRARIEQEALYWAEKASSAANIGLHLLDKLAREELRSKRKLSSDDKGFIEICSCREIC